MTGWLADNLVSILNGVALGCLLFALAVGLSLVFGVLDVLNLAHGSLFVAGAYAACDWPMTGAWPGSGWPSSGPPPSARPSKACGTTRTACGRSATR